MNRLATLAACLGALPAALRAQELPAPAPGVQVPAQQPGAAPPPAAVQPFPRGVAPLVPTPPPVEPVCIAEDEGGLRARCRAMLHPLRLGRSSGAECEACGRSCGENFCPSCGTKVRHRVLARHGDCGGRCGPDWQRIKEWFCYRPCYERTVPHQPTPYHAPLIAYFQCREPVLLPPAVPPCPPAGCAHGGCGPVAPAPVAAPVPVPVAPVRVGGSLDLFRRRTQPAAAVAEVPAAVPGARPPAVIPVTPPAPPAGQEVTPAGFTGTKPWPTTAPPVMARPVTRPFTNP